MSNFDLGCLHSVKVTSRHIVCVSEESSGVQEASDSMQELSVDASSEVASSDSAAETSNPAPIAAADN